MLVAISRTLQRRQSTHTSYLNELLKICFSRATKRGATLKFYSVPPRCQPPRLTSLQHRRASITASRLFYIRSAPCQTPFSCILPLRSVRFVRFSLASRLLYIILADSQLAFVTLRLTP